MVPTRESPILIETSWQPGATPSSRSFPLKAPTMPATCVPWSPPATTSEHVFSSEKASGDEAESVNCMSSAPKHV